MFGAQREAGVLTAAAGGEGRKGGSGKGGSGKGGGGKGGGKKGRMAGR